MTNPFFGVFLHALGGLAAGSFYVPYKKVKNWGWETYWLVQGFFAWVLSPIITALITAPNLWQVLSGSPSKSLVWTYIFGLLWGVGGLTFGLSTRYLGISLGFAMALGFCAAFGTVIPPIFAGSTETLFTTVSGLAVLAGIIVCLFGIGICGYAGILKEKQLTEEQKKASIKEFALKLGFAVAVFSGIMSACMAFAIDAGKPIAQAAFDAGTPDIYKNNPVFILAMGGGFTANLFWCLLLNVKNKTLTDYIRVTQSHFLPNVLLAGLGGIIWYAQFFFYGMGTTQMGTYDFASWSIHMAFIIVFSTLWGLALKEWYGVGKPVLRVIIAGLIVLIFSTFIIGYGNYLAAS